MTQPAGNVVSWKCELERGPPMHVAFLLDRSHWSDFAFQVQFVHTLQSQSTLGSYIYIRQAAAFADGPVQKGFSSRLPG